MKAHTEQQQCPGRCPARVRRGREELNHEETRSLLAKLKELVPNMPRSKKLSKLEIIQNVIDYILDLRIALETHPATHSSHPAGPSTSSVRQPLSVLPSSINVIANTCLAQEVTDAERVPANIAAELMSMVVPSPHPVSCWDL